MHDDRKARILAQRAEREAARMAMTREQAIEILGPGAWDTFPTATLVANALSRA